MHARYNLSTSVLSMKCFRLISGMLEAGDAIALNCTHTLSTHPALYNTVTTQAPQIRLENATSK